MMCEEKENNDLTKCQGVGCAFKESCGRFTRQEHPGQEWASYYALADTDCEYFEVMVNNNEETRKA